MRDVEFDLLLEAVEAAIAPVPEDEIVFHPSPSLQPQLPAANDNMVAWPLVPFPEGWYAAC